MKIQLGDYMIWHGSKTKTGQFSLARPDVAGGYLEPMRTSGGDDKFYANFLKSDSDFWHLGRIIAETHGMDIEVVGPDGQADFSVLRIHTAVRFLPQHG